MGKTFIEYNDKVIEYDGHTICEVIAQYAKDYVKMDSDFDMIFDIDCDVRDAVLINMVNYLSSVNKSHFHFNKRELYNNKKATKKKVDGQTILSVLFNHLSVHLFNDNLVNSVMLDGRRHDCHVPFDVDDGRKVIIEFVNYVSERNGFDRTFTLDDFYAKYKELSYKYEMDKLKVFLYKVNDYTNKLVKGENIDDIYKRLLNSYDLKYISKSGNYYFNDETADKKFRECMNQTEIKEINKELYPLLYAYEKYKDNCKHTDNETIKKRIKEMKEG